MGACKAGNGGKCKRSMWLSVCLRWDNYSYFGGEPIERVEIEVRAGKLKKGKAAGKDEITEEMIKGEGDRVVDWI